MKNYIFSAAFLLSITSFSQVTIEGTISGEESEDAIGGATIRILELNKTTASDTDGNYVFSGLGKGVYKIEASSLGYESQIKEVNITEESQEVALNFEMRYRPYSLNEAVITTAFFDEQKNDPYRVNVVKVNNMTAQGAVVLMDLAEKVPGVNSISTGPLVSRPIIRGLSGNRVLTVADNLRFETQQWDDEHGFGLNELDVQQIEIIKGPSSLLYGPEAMGGVIRVLDEPPIEAGKMAGDAVAAIYSNNLGGKATAKVKGATESMHWSVAALGRLLSDYFYNGYDFRVPNTRILEYGGKAKAGINRKWGSTDFSYVFNKAIYGILDGKDIIKDENGQLVNIDSLEKEKFPFEIEAPFQEVTDHRISNKTTLLAGKSKFNLVLGYQNNHRSENEELAGSKKGYTYLDMRLQTANYDLKWYLPKWSRFETIVGIQGMFQNNKNIGNAVTELIPDAKITDYAGLAVTKYHIDRFSASAGLRYDHRSLSNEGSQIPELNRPEITRSYNNVSGSVGISYSPAENFWLRTSYASGYRAPNLNELFSDGVKLESQRYEIGNVDFKKEQNRQWDVSAIFDNQDITVEGAFFVNTIDDYIYLSPTGNEVVSTIDPEQTVPEFEFLQANAEIKGGEADIDIHPASIPWVHFDTKFATLVGKRTDNDSYLPVMPATKLYNTLHFNFNDIKGVQHPFLNLGTETSMKQDQVEANELETPGYTLVNASMGGTYHNMTFTLMANNVLDKAYLDHLSRFRSYEIINPGVNVSLEVKMPLFSNAHSHP